MKTILVISALLFTVTTHAAEKTTTTISAPAAATTTAVAPETLPNTLAFNFVGLSQGKTNIYFDVGGISSRISPSLSFRSYSNKEERKDLNNQKLTVDRNLVTVGASGVLVKSGARSLILNPYLFFGTEKDAINTANTNGIGARLVGQANLTPAVALQAGLDANGMEGDFKSDVYVGMAFSL